MEERDLFELKDDIEKAIYMVSCLIDNYSLDDEIPATKNDAFAFAICKPNIYTNVRIINDYLYQVHKKLERFS